MQEIRLKNPYEEQPEQKISLLWHDIIVLKEKKKAKTMSVLFSIVFFTIGLVVGLVF